MAKMRRGWYGDSKRHSLASKGIKTSQCKTLAMSKVPSYHIRNAVSVDDARMELEPIMDFIQARVSDDKEEATISLSPDVTWKEFNQYNPEISKKDLIKLFDCLDESKRETYFALDELKKEGIRPTRTINTSLI